MSLFKNNKPTLQQGIIVGNMLPNNTVLVRLKEGQPPVPGIWACGIFSGMLGFKTTYIPPQKTPVLVFSPAPGENYVFGSFPQARADKGMQKRTVTREDKYDYHDAQLFSVKNTSEAAVYASQKPPVDLAEGELMIDNTIGVALTLLRGMASLSAGDLARVECHLLDDMVRIISDTFIHFTAFGDMRIVNDGGKLNVIWHGTSHDHEAWGLMDEKEPKAQLEGAEDRLNLKNLDSTTEEGRWRFSQYIGWLGNFVSMFVSDPVQALGQLAAAPYRSGKAKLHVNDDGAVVIQTVADIVLEKVVRIPVPNQVKRDEDPTGNRSDDVKFTSDLPHKDYLKTWQPSGELFEMAFQLRDYARWLNNAFALGRFRQLERDYKVPLEAEVPEPNIRDNYEKDKQEVNAGITNWKIAYATIRIYRDGSIQHVDAYGNSMTMTKVGLQIATPNDLLLQAGGSINIMAGRDVNITGKKNVTLTAATEKLFMKAELGINVLSKAGHIFIETFDVWLTKFLCSVNVYNNLLIDKLSGNTTTMGTVNVQKDVNVARDVNVIGLTKLTDDVEMFADLDIDGNTSIKGDTEIGGGSKTQGDVEIGGTAKIKDDVQLGADLEVEGNVTIKGTLDVDQMVKAKELSSVNLNVVDPALFGGWEQFTSNSFSDIAGMAGKLNAALGRSMPAGLRAIPAPIDTWLASKLSVTTKAKLLTYAGTGVDLELQTSLSADLNSIITSGSSIVSEIVAAGATISNAAQNMIDKIPTGADLQRLSRTLIEDAFPTTLIKDLYQITIPSMILSVTELGNVQFPELKIPVFLPRLLYQFIPRIPMITIPSIPSIADLIPIVIPGDDAAVPGGRSGGGAQVPTVPPTQGEFNFQPDGSYAADPIYETFTQQMMKDGEVASGGSWTFDAVNPVPGRGSPWPGQGKQQKVQRGADKLSIPQGSIPDNVPTPMTQESIVMKTQ